MNEEKKELSEEEIKAFFETFPEFEKAFKSFIDIVVATMKPLFEVILEGFKTIFDNLPEEFQAYLTDQITEEMKKKNEKQDFYIVNGEKTRQVEEKEFKEEMKKNDRETKKTEEIEGKGRRTPD